MKAKVLNLENKIVGTVELKEDIFALVARLDVIKQVIDWQRLKAMAGTRQTKTVSQISGTTKKPFKQKGTGNARQGSLRSVQMRGGAVAFGPVTRSHAIGLPKKVRSMGLRYVLSKKYADGKLLIIDSLNVDSFRTKSIVDSLKNFEGRSFFIIDGNEVNKNFALAVRNIPNVTAVPQLGANVYDIVKHEYVLLSLDAVHALEGRL